MEPLRVLIVDDESPARTRLRVLLEDLSSQLPSKVVAEAANGVEALAAWQAEKPDLLLVDIRMPKMDGLEVARHLVNEANPPAVVFTTAYEAHALEAFEVAAVDYLLKPVRADRLLAALRKALQRLPGERGAMLAGAAALQREARRYFSAQVMGKLTLIPVEEVLYLRADQKYVSAVTAQRTHLLDESLTKLEEEFPERFIRLHRGVLIARDAIAGFQREREGEDGEGEHWVAIVRGTNEHLPVSRRQWPAVKAFAKSA
jgi:two-component system response regulator AlgR